MAFFREPSSETQIAPTVVRYHVLGWLCLMAMISYVHRGCISVPAEVIGRDLHLDTLQMGAVMSAFFFTYAVFQLPSGWLGDRWGTRRALPLCMVLSSVTTGLMGAANGFLSLFGCRLGAGVGQAGIFPCAVNTFSRWFPPSRRAFPSGMLAGFMSWGAVAGNAVIAFLLGFCDWRTLFVGLGFAGLLWTVGFYWWFRDRPSEHSWVNDAERNLIREGRSAPPTGADSDRAAPTPWGTLLASPLMALICGQQFFRAAGFVFYQSWFPTYLQKTRHVSVEMSGYLTSVTIAGTAVGSMIGGALSDWLLLRTGRRKLARQWLTVVNLALCACFILLAYFVTDATGAVLLLTMGSFCAGMGGPVAYTITMDLGGKHISTVFSTMNMAGNIGGTLSPFVVSALVVATGENWDLVLLFFVAIYLAAAVCWVLLDPDRPLFPEAETLPCP
jgi:MFS family permease